MTGDSRPEAAVLLLCGALDTDIFFRYVQVYTDGPNEPQMLAQLKPPDLATCGWPPPRFNDHPFLINSGQLVTGVDYINCPVGSLPIRPTFTWQWDGSHFRAQQAVPNVVGSNVEEAKQTLQNAGFGYTVETVQSNQPAGMVISTEPAAGTLLDPSSGNITIRQSSGPPPSPAKK